MKYLFFTLTVLLLFQSQAQIKASQINDIGVSSIDSPSNNFCGNTQNIYVSVTNYGNTPIDSFFINWSLNGVIQPSQKKIRAIDTLGGIADNSISVYLTNYTFTIGVYTTIKVWTSLPNNKADSNSFNDTTTAVKTLTMMSGIYTVNQSIYAANNFRNIDSALIALNSYGVCGPVTINIANGNYTRITSLTIGNIAGANHINTINITGSNRDSCIISSSVTNTATILLNQSKYIKITNLTIANSSSLNSVAIAVVGTSNKISITNCKLILPVLSGSSTIGSAINFTGSINGISLAGCAADSILIDSNIIIGGGYGITFTGSMNTSNNRNIKVTRNIIIQVNRLAISIIRVYNAVDISKNKIEMNYSSTAADAISFLDNVNSSLTSHKITQNKIYHFTKIGINCTNHITTSSLVAPTIITNNLVVGYSLSNDIKGMFITFGGNGSNAMIFHNTVIIKNNQNLGLPYSENFAAIETSGSNTAQIKNNIFIANGGSVLPVKLGSNLLENYINNNIYYNKNPDGCLITIGGSLKYYSTNYSSKTIGGDSSYNFFPPFIDTSSTQLNFRLSHNCLLSAQSSTIAERDLDDTLRTLQPTIGAYQSIVSLNNLSPLRVINLSPIYNIPVELGYQDIKFTVINSGSNNIATYKAAYSINHNQPIITTRNNLLVPCAIDTVVFTGVNRANIQAEQNISFYTFNPNNTADQDLSSDTIKLTIKSSLKGNYSIGGTNADFSSPQEAVAKLLEVGLSGNVTFLLNAGNYTGQLIIDGKIKGISDTSTITFDGINPDSATLTASITSGPVVLLNRQSFITFRNLRLVNTLIGDGIEIYGTQSDIISSIKIIKCKIELPILSSISASVGIEVLGAMGSGNIRSWASDVTIDSNIVTGGSTGFAMSGSSNPIYNKSILIRYNQFYRLNGGAIGLTYIYNPIKVEGNVIDLLTSIGYFGSTGINFADNVNTSLTNSHIISGNSIKNFRYIGIVIKTTSSGYNFARTYVFNNEIISARHSSVNCGIEINQSINYNSPIVLNHNTIVINGLSTLTSTGALSAINSSLITVRNNIFIVNDGAYYPLYLTGTQTNNNVNLNLYYNSKSTQLVYRQGLTFNTSNYRTFAGGGDSSFNNIPPFVGTAESTIDLRLTNKCIIKTLRSSDVLLDINNNIRDSITGIGAHEVVSTPNNIQLEEILSPKTGPLLSTGINEVKLLVRNIGTNTINQYQTGYYFNSDSLILINKPSNVSSCGIDTVVFGTTQINLRATNTLKAFISAPNGIIDSLNSDDTLSYNYSPKLNGVFTVGNPTADFNTLSQAMSCIKTQGMSGNVTFAILPGVYNEAVSLTGPINGLNSKASLTIDGNSSSLVNLIADTSGPAIKVDQLSYIKIKNVSITNRKAGVGIAIIGSTANKNGTGIEISKCKITLPAHNLAATEGKVINITGAINGLLTTAVRLDSLNIDSNHISGGGMGITLAGLSDILGNRKLEFTNNLIDSCNHIGINIFNVYNPLLVRSNRIELNVRDSASYGILLTGNKISSGLHILDKNQIYNFGHTGIRYDNNSSNNTANNSITNNIVVSALASVGNNSGVYGIRASFSPSIIGRADILHNTIVMRGASTAQTGSLHTVYNSSQFNVANNILSVLSGGYCAMSIDDQNSGGYVNENVYYIKDAEPGRVLIIRGVKEFSALDYKVNEGGGQYSTNSSPYFNNALDFIPNLSINRGCDIFCGYQTTQTTHDVFGVERNEYPTVGAIQTVPKNLTSVSMQPFSVPVSTASQDLKFYVRNSSTDTIHSYSYGYIHNNNPTIIANKTKTLMPCAVDTVTFTGVTRPNLITRNLFKLFINLPNTPIYDDTLDREVHTALSGTYTIGNNGGYFSSFEKALSSMKSSGIIGPVVFDVQSGVYNERVNISGPYWGADSVNTITFRGTNPENTIITYDALPDYPIAVSDVPHITLKNLGVTSTSIGCIIVADKGAPSPKKANILVQNCHLKLPFGLTGNAINIDNSGSGFNYDTLRIDSNKIVGGTTGILVKGVYQRSANRYNLISNNIIDSCKSTGIMITDVSNPITISGNNITLYGSNTYGINMRYKTDGQPLQPQHENRVINNKIQNFTQLGIQVRVTGDYNRSYVTVTNNSIASAIENEPNSTDVKGMEVYVYGFSSPHSLVAHNTIAMQGLSTNSQSAALRLDLEGSVVKNNILAVFSGTYLPISLTGFGSANYTDHNLYYNGSNNGPRWLGRYGIINYDSSNFKNNYLGDSSFTVKPSLVDRKHLPANLALADYCAMNYGVNLGNLVPYDIHNKLRGTLPCMGAYEFTKVANNISVSELISPTESDLYPTGKHDVKVSFINSGTTVINQYQANYNNNNGAVLSKTISKNLAVCQIDTVTFTGNEMINLRLTNLITAYASSPNGLLDNQRDADTTHLTLLPTMAGEFTIGKDSSSDFKNIKEATERLKRGVMGAVKLRIKSGIYTEFVNLGSTRGASKTNNITFTSYNSQVDSVKIYPDYSQQYLQSGTALITFNTNANFYTFDKVTFLSNGNPVSHMIKLTGTSSFDTIKNCKVTQPYQTVSIPTSPTAIVGENYSGNGFCLIGNEVSGGYYSLGFIGVSRSNPIKNLVIDGNTFSNFYSLFQNYRFGNGGRFSNNTVIQNQLTYGIHHTFDKQDSGFQAISNSFITYPGKQMVIEFQDSKNAPNNKCIIANNTLTNTNTYFRLGSGSTNMDVVHNTVGSVDVFNSSMQNIRILNNLISGLYSFSSSNLNGIISDFNSVQSYYVNSVNLSPSQFKTLYKPQEANSVSGATGLISSSDPRPDTASSNSWILNGTGTHIGYTLNDKIGVSRPQTFIEGAPDIGAYEFTPTSTPNPLNIINIGINKAAFLLGTDTAAKIEWTGNLPISSLVGKVYTGSYPPNINPNNQPSLNMYWDFSAANGTYSYDISLYYRNPLRGSIPLLSNMIGAKNIGLNQWTFFQGNNVIVDSTNGILTIKGLNDFSLLTGTDLFNPLPVSLVEFKGKEVNKNALLQWTTAQEKNVSHFEIYASLDNLIYKQIGKNIKAKGNVTTATTYNYTDNDIFKQNSSCSYRLKIVDLDGKYTWSNVVLLKSEEQKMDNLVIYPNPFKKSISIYLPETMPTELLITDVSGKIIYEKHLISESNLITIDDLVNLEHGIYFISIKQDKQIFNRKLIKN